MIQWALTRVITVYYDLFYVIKPYFAVTNPATGEVLGSVPDMGAEDAKSAIFAAKNAFKDWKQTTAKVRKVQ